MISVLIVYECSGTVHVQFVYPTNAIYLIIKGGVCTAGQYVCPPYNLSFHRALHITLFVSIGRGRAI